MIEIDDEETTADDGKEPVVYFLRAKGSGLVKIGTTVNLKERIKKLQQGHPEELELLFTIPGGREVESLIHAQLEPHRVRAEWFALGPSVRRAKGAFPTGYRIGPRKVSIDRVPEIPRKPGEAEVHGDNDWARCRVRVATKGVPLGVQFLVLAHEIAHEFQHAGLPMGDTDEEVERTCDQIGAVLGDVLATLEYEGE